jgi:hypothetical protein
MACLDENLQILRIRVDVIRDLYEKAVEENQRRSLQSWLFEQMKKAENELSNSNKDSNMFPRNVE